MRRPPAFLVLLAAVSALALLILGVISERTYQPMYVPDTISYSLGTQHYGEYRVPFTMTALPPSRLSCNFASANRPSTACRWFIYLVDQPREERIRLLLHERDAGAPAAADAVAARYGDSETSIGIKRQQMTPDWLRLVLLLAFVGIFSAFGLLVLWRGRDAAVWLGLFCVCIAPFFFNFYGALPPDGMVQAWTLGVVLRRLADFALVAMALVLVAPYLKSRLVFVLAVATVAVSLLSLFFNLAPKFEAIDTGLVDGWMAASKGPTLDIVEILLLGALPLTLLAIGISKANEPERSRLAIIAGMIAIGLIGPLIDGTKNGVDDFNMLWATALLIPVGFTYAIPRYHVVDVGFIVNRIVIYVLLVATVSAVIAFAEVVITKFAEELSNPAHMVQAFTSGAFARDFRDSLVRSAPVVFVIVLSLRWVHQKLEEFVNHVFFRKRHEALNELKAFTKRTDFAQTREGLLRQALFEIGNSLGTRGVAVYERAAHGYHRSAHVGAFPAHIDEDDYAFLYMRTERMPVRLSNKNSALGESGIAFPMCLRSDLYGAVVCGPRLNEQYEGDYAPDELDVMQELVARLGEQLFALAADDRLDFINDIASGEVDDETLMARATQLRSLNSKHVRSSAEFR